MEAKACGELGRPTLVGTAGKRPRLEQVSELYNAQTLLLNITKARPRVALEMLERNLPCDAVAREQWRASARVAAVLGSCPRSVASFRSGMKHWIRFVEIIHGKENAEESAFPPRLGDVLAWSNTFRWFVRPLPPWRAVDCMLHRCRCFGTFANYLGYLRAACHGIGCDAPPVGHPAIKRSMIAIVKRGFYTSRAKMFIDRLSAMRHLCVPCPGLALRTCVGNMVGMAKDEDWQYAMLWLVTYVFLLRLPSEVGVALLVNTLWRTHQRLPGLAD